MEENLQVAIKHVKSEAADESSSALVLGSQDSPAPCGDTACRGGGGGGGDQTAEELQTVTTSTPVLLYPVSTERYFTTSGDEKTYLKIAPASAVTSAHAEMVLPSGPDFSSKVVLCLIEAVGRRWGLYKTRERSQLFQSVQEELASKGYMLPVEKIRRKWNNLIVTYKRVKDRSRETGHTKTSWEFFDLMDATLSDTVGSQNLNVKKNKSGTSVSSLSGPLVKKPPTPQSPSFVRHNGDFTSVGVLQTGGQGTCGGLAVSTTAAVASVNSTKPSEIKPLVVLSGDVTTTIHPATIVQSPSLISEPSFTDSVSTLLSLSSNPDLNTSRYVGRKIPSFSSGVIPFHLSNTLNSSSISSSFPTTCSSLSTTFSTSPSTTVASGEIQKQNEWQSNAMLLQEIIQRHEEEAYIDRVARRRTEAREKRRERREVRMAESLGRIATALELLSSKQDTIIALLQRLADRK
ncbi:uncharacterized protein [Takifugu rubripes]|uniref:uncharacterized protein n=1 Tax=Takifugu rubripes TaxID=31033 RepID=UPI00003610A7|nr:uncharacterized protein LOC105416415 [Takifugu rubripes]|eukprot:XP_011602010.1 PREDICTED: uncharacterized protein LOC105416415 isoform X1 [Takifugu rubripes]